ncbi:MAG: hypothetical protein IMW94_03180 [Thermoanaerobacter sp.]|nr:hypothetical protein [Thermoanaerobacter sp.]
MKRYMHLLMDENRAARPISGGAAGISREFAGLLLFEQGVIITRRRMGIIKEHGQFLKLFFL